MNPAAEVEAASPITKGNSVTIPVAEAWTGKHERTGLFHLLLVLEHGWTVQVTTFVDRPKKGVMYHPSFDAAVCSIFTIPLPQGEDDVAAREALARTKERLTRDDATRDDLNTKGGFVVGVETRDPKIIKLILTAAGLAARYQIYETMRMTNEQGSEIPMSRAFRDLGPAAVHALLHGFGEQLDSAKSTEAALFYSAYCCLFEWQFRRTCLEAGGEKSFTVQAFRK